MEMNGGGGPGQVNVLKAMKDRPMKQDLRRKAVGREKVEWPYGTAIKVRQKGHTWGHEREWKLGLQAGQCGLVMKTRPIE